MLIPVYNITR